MIEDLTKFASSGRLSSASLTLIKGSQKQGPSSDDIPGGLLNMKFMGICPRGSRSWARIPFAL